jgi:c-di-GMP-binding flagellar brake protein YcgR
MMAIKSITDERRKYPRSGISFPVECKLPASNTYFYTVSKDISAGGIKIISNRFFSKDNLLKVSINFIDTVIELRAKIVWCNKTRAPETFHAGLQFIEINPEGHRTLCHFLDKILPSTVNPTNSPAA